MNNKVILAMVRKDFYGLLPLILLAWVVFFIQPVIANLNVEEAGIDTEFLIAMQANFYWVAFFLSTILMVSVLQHDPASSLNHDWLTRPISRVDWILAKLLFLVVTICVPVVMSRFLVNVGNDLGIGLSLRYALGIQEFEAMILVPLFFAVALLTPTFKKSIFLLVMVFILFLLPGWSVTRPILSSIGIDLGNELDGMMWLQTLPLVGAGVIGSVLIYWFLYVRRQAGPAYITFWCSVAVMFFSVYPPRSLYDWDKAVRFHQAVINEADDSLEHAVELVQTQACFPASFMDGSASGSQDDAVLSAARWVDAALDEVDPGDLTIATPVRTTNRLLEWHSMGKSGREISVDWRIDRFRARAWYEADSLDEKVDLLRSTTAENRFSPISHLDTDYWMVPGDRLQALSKDPSTRLVIEYDMALLSPTPHELPVDGVRYSIPEAGSCKAVLDAAANVINVDCMKRGVRPELLSAQLIGLEGSRVDSWPRTNFTADWVEFLGRSHFEFTLQQPSLVDGSTILLTSYNVERVVREQLVSRGVLGDSTAICPLPDDEQYAQVRQSNWSDKSPHETSSIAVERGVRVEVLDWRPKPIRNVPTLVLLPGLGATAHSYDALAQRLSADYNVIAITRRGTGASSRPDHGYGTARLSEDVLQVMETLEIDQPVLVGHSIAGEELSYLGANHPARFSGLVYLDAAFDRTVPVNRQQRELGRMLPEAPPIRPAEAISYEAFGDYMRRLGRERLQTEGEILASYDLSTGTMKHDPLYLDAIQRALQAPEYGRISIPALAMYAVPASAQSLMEPWYDESDPQVRSAVQRLFEIERERKLAEARRFDEEVADSDVIVLEDANHWIFGSNEDDVYEAMTRFVDQLP